MSASESQQAKEFYEFGPFRVDPEKEVLLRAGQPVQLTPKTFQILLVLVRHHKEVVTKDDLMKAVWPDTFVEEANLSRNIFMLRKALGETPQDHQYVLTVPGRGYRFAETVRRVPEQRLNIVAAEHSKVQVEVAETKLWITWIAVAAVVLVAVAVGTFKLFVTRPLVLTGKDTVVLADFANSTGDPVFDDTLRQGLAVELQQSPFLEILSDERVQQTLRLMGRPKDARLTREIAREICERTGSTAILVGSIAALGSQYVLGLQAQNCSTGSILDREQERAARREDVLDTLSQMARKFRRQAGESFATVEKHSTHLWEATTSSLEALKAYSTAMKVLLSSGNEASNPLFERAVELDPKFAMAYAQLGLNYTTLGEWALARENTTKAWQLRGHASDPEKFFIEFNYEREATGNLEKAFRTLESWAQTYPRYEDPDPRLLMAGLSAKGTGRWERVIEQAKKDIAIRPDAVFGYGNLKDAYFFLDRFDDAEQVLQQAAARKLEAPGYLVFRYNIAFLKGEKERMDRIATLAQGKRGAEQQAANSQALVAAHSGQLQRAHQLSSRARDLARQEGTLEAAARYQAVEAVWQGLYGNAAAARKNATAALADSNGRDIEYAAGLALGFAGDVARTEVLAADLEKRFPEDTFARFTYVPVLRGLAAVSQGRPTGSLEQLQNAIPYELAVNGLDINLCLGGLHSAYVRGEAYLAMQRPFDAAAEFDKILKHRGIVGADPIGALAHLQLGRAFQMSNNNPAARAAYAEFLKLWKDADPDIPILKQAKAEYARLQ